MKEILESKEFVAAIAGSIIGGILTLVATIVTLHSQRKTSTQEEDIKIQSIRNALYAEIRTAWKSYITIGVGFLINRKLGNRVFLNELTYALPSPTSIYEANSLYVAKIGNKDFVSKIILFYSTIKNINELAKAINIEWQTPGDPGDNAPIFKMIGILNEQHSSLEELTKELLILFDTATSLKQTLSSKFKSKINFLADRIFLKKTEYDRG